ncbi:hypothetical protein AMC32_14850, partial [Listeria monocytogenes]|nr:hypothetical protein [Listeria monocytogenes]EAD9324222.1 hypothetical protein [Listeria monocytogenes]
MTQYHYLASKSLLSKGMGEEEKSPRYIYINDLDFLNLNFENNIDYDTKEMFSYSKHFSPICKYQVAISEGKLPLKNEYTGDAYELKSLRILYDYVINASKESDRLELYTSWNGEEDLPLTGKKEISIEKLNPES